MKPVTDVPPSVNDSDTTGLPWPKTWSGSYIFVIASFIFWLGLLLALTGLSA